MRRNKLLLLGSSLGVLLMLATAALRENVHQEWRRLQRGASAVAETGAALAGRHAGATAVELRQIVVPDLRVTDRCISCHLGMAPGERAVAGDPVLGPHPDVVHDPTAFGCTVCHGGQGRATESAAAHGRVPHWPEPMIPIRCADAGCGSCHTPEAVPHDVRLARGAAYVERYDCLTCHRLDGRGGTLRPASAAGVDAPDLSRIGVGGVDANWYVAHLDRREAARGGAWRESMAPIPAVHRRAIDDYLATRVGAPALVRAEAVFHARGCRGCHRVGGVGGDDGPDLTRVGLLDPGQLDFTHVHGEHSVAGWLAAHFRAPATVVPGSQMPDQRLAADEIDALTLYMLSLRRSDVPGSYWPLDRIRTERLGARDFASDGATLYHAFCSACHGPRGQGVRYPGSRAYPAIAHPDFLVLVSDTFLATAIARGRPTRRMPAWGEMEGGLREAEIARIVEYLRELGAEAAGAPLHPAPEARPRRWVGGDAALGARLYAAYCGGCHGPGGEGNEGPALAHPALLETASDTYLVETILRGRRGTSMEGFAAPSTTRPSLARDEVEAIVTHIRTWEGGS